ncbi:MAG: type II toxin-antitoxin system VapC family toxin [Deltaproteobacteria bacterium]|nr:type II toxin-antitoxin system VapC family toxin [Deltaproteobacteria bacterium]MBI3017325.1 type II toxin-antitoxin system VapC family toxin [Deltaproteobacteria bacterium]
MIGYIDTSVVLRLIFGEENSFKKIDSFEVLYASTLVKVEALRAIDRLRLEGKFSDQEVAHRVQALLETLEYFSEISIEDRILGRASEAFPTIVGTLDAIHLASAWLVQKEQDVVLTFLTHDAQLKRAAQAMGFQTVDL